ncbi:MAG: HAMP domain-containing protein [Chloroflexi bacterium]|nr:HAMP domain-containing protein [Chloroflexota bacterium]
MNLRWKLTLSYTLVTTAAILLVEVGLLILAVLLLASPRSLAQIIVPVLADATAEIAPALEQAPPNRDAAQRWLMDLVRTGRITRNGNDKGTVARLHIEPLYLRGGLLVTLDGKILVADPPSLCAQGDHASACLPPSVQAILNRALRGEQRSTRLYAHEQGRVWLAVPIRGSTANRTLGALLLIITVPQSLGEWLRLLAEPLLPSALAVLAFAAVIGTVFGYFTARGLTRRLRALAQAADAWSRGDFRVMVHDPARDEIGQLAQRLNRMAEQLHNLVQTRQELAALEERNRLARELHDAVKQQVFAAGMQLAAARNHLPHAPARAQAALTQAEALLRQAQRELTALIHQLRPAALEGRGLIPALRDLLSQWQSQTGIAADLQVQGQRALPLAVEQALFRVVQEALANAARHSQAQHVVVRVQWEDEAIHLLVHDDGRGFDPARAARRGVGLHSMAERVQAIGGSFQVKSAPGAGTRIHVTVPLRADVKPGREPSSRNTE